MKSDTEERESIWSVERRTKNVYFALFIVQFAVGMIAVVLNETVRNNADGIFDTGLAIWESSASVAITSAAVAITITEAWRFIMVLARTLEERLERTREKRRAEGRKLGIKEATEMAIRQTAVEIDDSITVNIDASQWFDREVMRVALSKAGKETDTFEVTMEQALSSRLFPLLKDRIASLD